MLREAWDEGGIDAVHAAMELPGDLTEAAVEGSAASFATRPVMSKPPTPSAPRPLRYANGFEMSPYADVRPPGTHPKDDRPRPARRLWHSSPGSSGG
jgi:error-prone DNA polymerase